MRAVGRRQRSRVVSVRLRHAGRRDGFQRAVRPVSFELRHAALRDGVERSGLRAAPRRPRSSTACRDAARRRRRACRTRSRRTCRALTSGVLALRRARSATGRTIELTALRGAIARSCGGAARRRRDRARRRPGGGRELAVAQTIDTLAYGVERLCERRVPASRKRTRAATRRPLDAAIDRARAALDRRARACLASGRSALSAAVRRGNSFAGKSWARGILRPASLFVKEATVASCFDGAAV